MAAVRLLEEQVAEHPSAVRFQHPEALHYKRMARKFVAYAARLNRFAARSDHQCSIRCRAARGSRAESGMQANV
jgi:hypothetical protein